MKKITLFLLVLCGVALNLFAQDKAPNEFQALSTKYKYRLKQYGEYGYGYDDQNRLIWIKNLEGSENEDTSYFYYDNEGYLYEKLHYYDGQIGKKIVLERDENKYVTKSIFWYDFRDKGLEEWVRYTYKYNEKKQLVGAMCEARDPRTGNWVIAHYVERTYNDAGNLTYSVRKDNNNEWLTSETLKYNDNGKLVSLIYSKNNPECGKQDFNYEYVYDDNGDAIQCGHVDFLKKTEYDTTKLASETFFPAYTLHEILYTGLISTLDGGLQRPATPLENGSEHQPIRTTRYPSKRVFEATYEGVPVENATAKVVENNVRLYPTIVKDEINIEIDPQMIGSIAKIYNIEGKLVQSVKLNSSVEKVAIALPKGNYIMSIQKQNSHFVVE